MEVPSQSAESLKRRDRTYTQRRSLKPGNAETFLTNASHGAEDRPNPGENLVSHSGLK